MKKALYIITALALFGVVLVIPALVESAPFGVAFLAIGVAFIVLMVLAKLCNRYDTE